MQNITIGRYGHPSITSDYAGWIEGIRDNGTTWIMWLDANGNPISYYADRDHDGGVNGEPINLT